MISTVGYLGILGNINLNDLAKNHCNGFYEVKDPNVVNTFNNYPDDSHLLYKIMNDDTNLYNKLRELQPKYATEESINYIKNLFRPTYEHLAGLGDRVITGILENTVSQTEDFCMQKFYRVPDKMVFLRIYDNNRWYDWVWENNELTIYHNYANDLIFADDDLLLRAAEVYAPKYDDRRIRENINSKATWEEYNQRLKKRWGTTSGIINNNGTWRQMTDILVDEGVGIYSETPGVRNARIIQQDRNNTYLGDEHFHDGAPLIYADGREKYGLQWVGNNIRQEIANRYHMRWQYLTEGVDVWAHNANQWREVMVIVRHPANFAWKTSFVVPMEAGFGSQSFRLMAFYEQYPDLRVWVDTNNNVVHVWNNTGCHIWLYGRG